jgi:hypothetical protein
MNISHWCLFKYQAPVHSALLQKATVVHSWMTGTVENAQYLAIKN